MIHTEHSLRDALHSFLRWAQTFVQYVFHHRRESLKTNLTMLPNNFSESQQKIQRPTLSRCFRRKLELAGTGPCTVISIIHAYIRVCW